MAAFRMSRIWRTLSKYIYIRQRMLSVYPSMVFVSRTPSYTYTQPSVQNMRFKMVPPLTRLYFLLQLHAAFSLPSTRLNPPSLSLISNSPALNLSKPTYIPIDTHFEADTDTPPCSSDKFPIPNTELVVYFERFGSLVEASELNDLLTQAQEDIQVQINVRGASATASLNRNYPWISDNIAFDVYRINRIVHMTLGEFRSLVEGLVLYMVKGRRSREASFLVSREGEVITTNLARGDIWSASDGA